MNQLDLDLIIGRPLLVGVEMFVLSRRRLAKFLAMFQR
tara:strand:- start:297 stop:410 length:114 start_codon:yes stop_codon:yes gene_type:complete